MSIRLEDEIKDRLENLADATDRSRSFLAAEAIRQYVENNEWQISEIRAAVIEADANEFATSDEVSALARKWDSSAG